MVIEAIKYRFTLHSVLFLSITSLQSLCMWIPVRRQWVSSYSIAGGTIGITPTQLSMLGNLAFFGLRMLIKIIVDVVTVSVVNG